MQSSFNSAVGSN